VSEYDNVLTIIIEDNGIGFDLNSNKSGVGLINIERRIEKIEGELVIDTSKNNGTTVILHIPL
ncbi:MAG: ATP-binding protein, partial [Bacteroidota bacterium]